jgi:hypothetical protein
LVELKICSACGTIHSGGRACPACRMEPGASFMPRTDWVPYLVPERQTPEASFERAVLARVDGKKTVRELIAESPFTEAEIVEAILSFAEFDLIRFRPSIRPNVDDLWLEPRPASNPRPQVLLLRRTPAIERMSKRTRAEQSPPDVDPSGAQLYARALACRAAGDFVAAMKNVKLALAYAPDQAEYVALFDEVSARVARYGKS